MQHAACAAFSLTALAACAGNWPTAFPPTSSGNAVLASRRLPPARGAVKQRGPTIYVLNENFDAKPAWVSIYGNAGASLLRKIDVKQKYANPALTTDSSGHFYLYDGDEPAVLRIYTGRGAKIVQNLQQLDAFGVLTIDGAGNLYTTCRKGQDVCEYSHAKRGVLKPAIARRIGIPGALPFYLAADGSGNLGISGGIGGFYAVAPGQTHPYWQITGTGLDFLSEAFDSSGNLYVVTGPSGSGAYYVSVYAPGGTSPVRTITDGASAPAQLAFDGFGNLYVLNDCLEDCGTQPQSVSVYAPGGSSPIRTITAGIVNGEGHGIAVDAAGDLVVTNVGGSHDPGNFVVYAPGESKPIRTVTAGAQNPGRVMIGR